MLMYSLLGMALAYKADSRITYTYTNELNTGVYTKVSFYDATKCKNPAARPCSYVSNTDLGSTITESTLIAIGAVPSTKNSVYIP